MGFRNFYISGPSNEYLLIQQRVYETRVNDVDELWQCLLHVWHDLMQLLIDDTDDQCPTLLHACVYASGRT